MKVIDLLNKIAKGEEVEAKHRLFDLEYKNLRDFHVSYKENIDYFTLGGLISLLNDEVEVIEEDKKIEKITLLGEEIKLGSISSWLKDKTINEEKIASCIECNAMRINEIINRLNGDSDE